jgi:hypothetical protein
VGFSFFPNGTNALFQLGTTATVAVFFFFIVRCLQQEGRAIPDGRGIEVGVGEGPLRAWLACR